jgi:hypothetical protein
MNGATWHKEQTSRKIFHRRDVSRDVLSQIEPHGTIRSLGQRRYQQAKLVTNDLLFPRRFHRRYELRALRNDK